MTRDAGRRFVSAVFVIACGLAVLLALVPLVLVLFFVVSQGVQALNIGGENRTVLRRAAICYEALEQRDRTLAVLQSAPPDLLRELNRQPDLVALRADQRFAALLPPAAQR